MGDFVKVPLILLLVTLLPVLIILSVEPTADFSPAKIGLIIGSTRALSNSAGVATYLEHYITAHFSPASLGRPHEASGKTPTFMGAPIRDRDEPLPPKRQFDDAGNEIVHANASVIPVMLDIIHLATTARAGHPLPLAMPATPPAFRPRASVPDAYPDAGLRAWSRTVLGWDGALIVIPEYNAGMPAVLKNAIDQLGPEWMGLPVGIVTLGAGGGGRVQEQARVTLKNVGAVVADSKVQIKLRKAYTEGEWVEGSEDWWGEHEAGVASVVAEMLKAVADRRKASGGGFKAALQK